MMNTKKDQLIFILTKLEQYWSSAGALKIFIQTKYANELVIDTLIELIKKTVITLKATFLSEQRNAVGYINQQAEIQKVQDIDRAEKLLEGLGGLGNEQLEQNMIDGNDDGIIHPDEMRDLTLSLSSRERKRLAQELSSSEELKTAMFESCSQIFEDISSKIRQGDILVKEDVELFQLSVFFLGKNTAIVIDGVISSGKLTEQIIKEINPEYFRIRSLEDRIGSECLFDLNSVRLKLPEDVRNRVFSTIEEYRTKFTRLRLEGEEIKNILYAVFVQGVNSHGMFTDTEWFDNLDNGINRFQEQLRAKEEIELQQQALRRKQQNIQSLDATICDIQEQLLSGAEELKTAESEYDAIYTQFTQALRGNNTLLAKIRTLSPYIAALSTGPIAPVMLLLRGKGSPDNNEKQQLLLYDKLTEKYDEIVQLQAKIKHMRGDLDTKGKQQQCLYYEVLRDSGEREMAKQALINLINQYGDSIRTKYTADIKLYMESASEMHKALFTANKVQLNAIVQQKSKEIDIAQQVLSGVKSQWGTMDASGLFHLSQGDIELIIGSDGLQQARMMGAMTEVRDNTANVRVIQNKEVIVDQGNRVGTKRGYELQGGTTSTHTNTLYAQYRLASDYFKVLTVPGMGSIHVKIDPNLYNQIISFSERGKQLTFDPVYDPRLQCFTIGPSNVFISWIDRQGTIGYQARPGNGTPIRYVSNREYQSLLQVKRGLTNLLVEQGPIIELLSYRERLEQVIAPIQKLAQSYSQTPGDASLSNAIIGDLTKPGGLKSQLTNLKGLLAKSVLYESTIAELKQHRSGVYDQFEQQLYDIESMIKGLSGFVTQIDELLRYSVRESADARTLKEFAITVSAVIGGVLLAVATGGMASGASAMIVSAAAGTIGGMTSTRLTQEIIAYGTNTGGLTNDLHSDIGKCISGQEKWEEVLPKVAMEFVQGSATTLLFMGVGRIVGQQLEKFVTANAGVVSREVKIAYRVRKAISSLNDNEIQLLEKKGFARIFSMLPKEAAQEFTQEGVQQAGEKGGNALGARLEKFLGVGAGLGSGLATIISIITSIAGKVQYRAGNIDVFMEGHDVDTNTTRVSYKGDSESLSGRLNSIVAESGYSLEGVSASGELKYSSGKGGHTILFTTTQESTSIKEMDLVEHGKMYGIAFDEQRRDDEGDIVYHYTYNDLELGNNNLITYLSRNGMIIENGIADDGSFVVLAKNGELIMFTKSVLLLDNESAISDGLIEIPDEDENESMQNDDVLQLDILAVEQIDVGLREIEEDLSNESFELTMEPDSPFVSRYIRVLSSILASFNAIGGFGLAEQFRRILLITEIISQRSPDRLSKNLPGALIERFYRRLEEAKSILNAPSSASAIVYTLYSKYIEIAHTVNIDHKRDSAIVPRNADGSTVYRDSSGNDLSGVEAFDASRAHDQAIHQLFIKIGGWLGYAVKSTDPHTDERILQSDKDVAMNVETSKRLIDELISDGKGGGMIKEVYALDKNKPDQHIQISIDNKEHLYKFAEEGSLRVVMRVEVDGVILEHEYFAENGNGPFDIFDSNGLHKGTPITVHGTRYMGYEAAVGYVTEVLKSEKINFSEGVDVKGKISKRIINLLQLAESDNRHLPVFEKLIQNIKFLFGGQFDRIAKSDEARKHDAFREIKKFLVDEIGFDPEIIDALPEPGSQAEGRNPIVEPGFAVLVKTLQSEVLHSKTGAQKKVLSEKIQQVIDDYDLSSRAGRGYFVHLNILMGACMTFVDIETSSSLLNHQYGSYRRNLPDVSLEEARQNIGNTQSPFHVPQRYYNQGGQVYSREVIKTLAGPPLLGACEMAYDKNIVTYGSDYTGGVGTGYIDIRLDKLSSQNRSIIESMQGNPMYDMDFKDVSGYVLNDKDAPFVRITFSTAATTGELQRQSLDFIAGLETQEYMADVFDLQDDTQNTLLTEILIASYHPKNPDEIDMLFDALVAEKTIIVSEDYRVYIHPREYERVTGKKLSEHNPNPDYHYFFGKISKFRFSENEARGNASMIQMLAGDATNEKLRFDAKERIMNALREKQVILPESFVVDDALLDAIISAFQTTGGSHEGLAHFSLGTLLNKHRRVKEYLRVGTDLNNIQHTDIVRFLMEGGFLGGDVSFGSNDVSMDSFIDSCVLIDGILKYVSIGKLQELYFLNRNLPRQLQVTFEHLKQYVNYNNRMHDMGRKLTERSDFINFVTGNYNPQTGKITLYRFIDQDAASVYLKNQAITSRAVDVFGNGSVDTTIEFYKELGGGKVSEKLKDVLIEKRDLLQLQYAALLKDEQSLIVTLDLAALSATINELNLMILGNVPSHLQSHFQKKADRMNKVKNKEDFFYEVLEEFNGGTPPDPLGIMSYDVIHRTTDKGGFGIGDRRYRITAELDLNDAFPSGRMMNNQFEGSLDFNELERTSFGAHYPTSENAITVTDLQTNSEIKLGN